MVEERSELSFATFRMRSSAWDTLSRSCARRVFRCAAFPLAPALRSTDSAASRPALFTSFPASQLQWLACVLLYRRFAAGVSAGGKLGHTPRLLPHAST